MSPLEGPGAGVKPVLAHYFTPYPLSFDGKDPAVDYYATGYLTPGGEGGKHREYGGFLRDRPLPSPNLDVWKAGGRPAGELADARTEVAQASSFGYAGWALDILSLSSTSDNTRRQLVQLQACAETPAFRSTLQLDLNVPSVVGASVAAVATQMVKLIRTGGVLEVDGRPVVSPFKAEAWTPEQHRALVAEITRLYGRPYYVPCLVNWPGNLPRYAAVADALQIWGDRVPGSKARMIDAGRQVGALGLPWWAPIAAQDYRPRDGAVWEADGTRALQATIEAAVESGAALMQANTWNDYSENTHVAPSRNNGDAWSTLVQAWTAPWREGRPARIVRRAVVTTQRPHPVATKPTSQTKLATFRGGTPVDVVETLVLDPTTQSITRTARPLVAAGTAPTIQDLGYRAVMVVDDAPVDPKDARIAELEQQLDQITDERDLLRVDRDARVRELAAARATVADYDHRLDTIAGIAARTPTGG
jgi:hypothetical protein